MITRTILINKINDYLCHTIRLDELIAWSEKAMMEDEFDPKDLTVIRQVIARLGLADVREFGLTWEDCEDLIHQLGYHLHVELIED